MQLKKGQPATVDTNTLDLLPIAVAIFDNKKIYFLNKKAIELFNVSKEQLKKINSFSIFNFLDKKYHTRIKQNNIKIIKGEYFLPIDLEFKTFKNKTYFIEAKSNRVLFENKYVVQSLFIDTTVLKQQQQDLINSDALLQKISQNSFDVIFKFSFEPDKLVFISESAKKVLGYTAEEIYKAKDLLLKATHPDDRKHFIFNNRQQLNSKKKNKEEKVTIRFTHKKGNLIYLETSLTPVYDSKNKITGVIGSIRDITERINAEILLNETKEKFDLITKSSNDVIAFFTYLPQEKYTYVSPNIKKILGYEPKELLRESNFFNKRLVGDKAAFLKQDKLAKGDQKKNFKRNYYYTYKTFKKNKEEIWLENNLTPITGPDGKISFFLNILRDITEQKEKEIELQFQHLNYRNLLDSSPIAYIIHRQGVTVFCNNATLKLLQLKNEKQILGKFVLDYLVEEDRMRAMDRIKEIYSGVDVEKSNNYTVVDTKGNTIETEMKSIVIKFNNANCILTLINNVSDQRKFEKEKLRAEMIKVNNEFLLLEIKERQEAEKKLLEKTAHLSSIFESSNHLIWTINKNFEITSFNKNFYDVILQKHKIRVQIGQCIADHLKQGKQEYEAYWYPKYKEALAGKKLEFEKEDYATEKIYRRIYINPIFDSLNEVTEINCIAHDNTGSKVYEQKLISQTSKLQAIFESGSQLIWTINKEYELTSYNQNYFKLLSKAAQAKKQIYLKDTILSKELFEFWKEKFDQVFKGQQQIFTHKSIIDNQDVYREVFLHPIYSKNQIIEVSAIAQDITERIESESKIIKQSAKLQAIFDSSHHYIWTINQDHKLTSFNKNYFELVTALYNTKPFLGLKLDRGALSNNQDYAGVLDYHYDKAFKGVATNFEIETLDKDHKKIYLDIYFNPIIENDKIVEVSGIAHNITDKKVDHQRVEQSLKEKDVLLKEVHHRVKNNMQIISSILNLQSSYVTDNYTLALLKESQNRIKTMAYIHESLYQNKSFTSVNFSEYIQTLSKNIIQSYVLSSEKVELILNLEKINLNLDVSIPAGLIINELITNAIKHAFPDAKKGKVCLNLKSESNNIYLEVTDNGVGIPPGVDYNNTNTLGLQLVNTLIDQLDGEINFKSEKDKGTEVLIKFKM
ncbi:MAG: PAS domain S-box protein [Bacteroidetes bacterium]|nr:PAS domain S-box protein [Bacteroidota bacterium]